MSDVCEIDEKGRPTAGLCFRTMGESPSGDVMLAQKIALENCGSALAWQKDSFPALLRSGEAGFSAESRLV
jgi:hypothetical protein